MSVDPVMMLGGSANQFHFPTGPAGRGVPDAEGNGQVVGGEAVRQVQEVGTLREAEAQPDLLHSPAFRRQRRIPGMHHRPRLAHWPIIGQQQMQISGFLDKNRDTVMEEQLNILRASNNELLSDLFLDQTKTKKTSASGPGGGKKQNKKTVRFTHAFTYRACYLGIQDYDRNLLLIH